MTRECGTCSLCCKLVPVRDLDKPANQWCTHARPGVAHACSIYPNRPAGCRTWSCLWLDSETAGPRLRRPDSARYVCDPAAALIEITQHGQWTKIPVMQVWVDPDYPDSWRDPALQEVMYRVALAGVATLLRYGEGRCVTVFAPPMTPSGTWELRENPPTDPETTIEQLTKFFRGGS